MKKILVLLFTIILFGALFTSCKDIEQPHLPGRLEVTAGTGSSTTAPSTESVSIDEFIALIKKSEYVKAIEYYNNNIYGSFSLEMSAAEAIADLFETVNKEVLNGKKTSREATATITVVDKVIQETALYVEEYEVLVDNIESSVESRAAFSAAVELENLENYKDAITQYSLVINADSNYTSAQEGISRCTETLKAKSFTKAETLAKEKKYIEAIAELKSLLSVLSEDSELLSKITVYEKTYITNTITAAEEAFLIPSDDYSKSLSIINSALQFYPNNEELLSKKDYYYSFAPVKMASLSQYDNSGHGATFLANEKDPLGNLHTDVFRSWSYMYDHAWVVYILDGNYNKLTLTVYGTVPSDDEISSVSIRDYSKGDYDLSTVLYMDETLKISVFPHEVEIDVTGVKMIRVYVGYGIAVADAELQKTVK